MILYVYGGGHILDNQDGRGTVLAKCLSLLEKMAKNCMKMITTGWGGESKIGQKVIT